MDGKLYKTMDFILNAFLLNTLWLVMCLPILTIFPATTAMFGVVREWKKQGDIRVFSSFFRRLKENFKQSFVIGIGWLLFTLLLIGDFVITNQINSNVKYIFFSIFFLLTVLYLFVSIYIFPVMVHYQASWKNVIKNSLLLSLANLPYTLVSIMVISGILVLCYYFPGATLLCFSVGAYLIYTFVSRGFHRNLSPKL